MIFLRPHQSGPVQPAPVATAQTRNLPCGMTLCYPETISDSSLMKIEELESEIMKLLDVSSPDERPRGSMCSERMIEEVHEGALPDLDNLEEVVVFSPEIQLQGSKSPEAEEEGPDAVAASWGDVFVRTGEEYPFLFTVYTKSYARNQWRRYGERISPSSRDVLLDRKQLDRRDIIRAVIKWINLYCPVLKGKPIRLENDSTLQTLVRDPLVEIQCPESVF